MKNTAFTHGLMTTVMGTVLLSLGTLVGCGANDAIVATKSMPDKIDATNAEVKKTNNGMNTMIDKVGQTNDGMQTMITQVKQTNESMKGMNDSVDQTNAGMQTMIGEVKKTNAGISKTNNAVHNQTLAVALAEMLKEENTRYLFPPTGMMPAGQVFANEATSDEIVQLVYTFFKEIETTFPDPSERGDDGNWKPDTIKRVDHDKNVKFTAAQVIVGLAPQATIEEIVNEQIDQGGRYEQTAYQILALRYDFIDNLLLRNGLFAAPMTNPGMIADAVQQARSITFITSLPYVDKLVAQTTQMLSPDDNHNVVVKANRSLAIWKQINKAFANDLDKKYLDPQNKEASKVQALQAEVQSHLPTPPSAPAVAAK